MATKRTYEELEKRVKELENEVLELKQAEEALRLSHANLSALLENTSDYILLSDRDGLLLMFNSAYAGIIKEAFDVDMKPGLNPHKLLPDKESVAFWDASHRRVLSGEKFRAEYKHKFDDENVRDFEVSFHPVIEDGEVRGFSEVIRDISKRKRMEEALRESEEKYRTLLDRIEEAYFEVDIAGNFTFFNDSLSKSLGYSDDELMGTNNRDYMSPDSSKKIYELFNQIYNTGNPIKKVVYEIIRKDGSRGFHELSASLMKDQAGQAIGFRGIAHDITERKQAEEALRESEAYFREITENASDMILILDNNGTITYASSSVERFLGYSPEEMIGKSTLDFIHPEDIQRAMLDFGASIRMEETAIPNSFRVLHKDGSECVFEGLGKNLLHHPTVSGFIMNIRDITESRRLQAQLQEAQKMEAIATLAGGVAHLFNNALSSITGHTGLLEMEYPEDEKIMDYAKAMKQSAYRMAHLTSQLLAYARGGKYNPQTMSLSNFVEGALPIIRHILDPDIRLETDLPQDVMNVKVDRTQMQMVLSALMINSNEAINPPGRIRISTRNIEVDQGFIKDHPGLKPGPYVCLSIEDDGKGMDEETKERIFEPFFTTHFIGRGLGMPAAYGIVTNHDGAITVDSEPGKGATVFIYLPALEAREAVEAKMEERIFSASAIDLPTGEGTVLLIEDEETLVKLFKQILERLGYRVLEAMTGEEAVELAKTFDGQIDLALLDIKLPDMDGGRVYPLIMEARPDLKVIVCSGYSIDGPAQAILDAGAEGFIQKPFSIAPFAEKLKEVLEGK
jgi:two-component system, cell cycle sensor histidine kinase and response regulator CckA